MYDILSAAPTVTASSAYTANDAVGGELSFELGPDDGKRSARIHSALITDLAAQGAAMELWLFSASQGAGVTADADAFDPTDANLANVVAVIPFGTHYAATDNGVSQAEDIALPLVVVATDKTLYGQLVTRGTPTYGSTSDLTVKLGVEPY